MLLTKEVEIDITNDIKYYEQMGYNIPRYKDNWGRYRVKKGTKIIIKTEELRKTSKTRIEIQCDLCKKVIELCYSDYINSINLHPDYYFCSSCHNKTNVNKTNNTKLLKSKSFAQWCLDNDRQDILDRWDYESNKGIDPNFVGLHTHKKYYFICPRNIHKSELKNLDSFVSGEKGAMNCKVCNSFAQWGIDNLGKDFLDKYWDWDKNNELDIDPWKVARGSSKSAWFKCQEKDYHPSNKSAISDWRRGHRCPYCSSNKIHSNDSVGYLLQKRGLSFVWSDKNKTSPYEYPPMSTKVFMWRCHNQKHGDFYRSINASNKSDFKCPFCSNSQGEERVLQYLSSNNILYIAQKEFIGLTGVGNGNLSYDFYLEEHNVLIEYQGKQHEQFCQGIHQTINDFKRQQEHDKRKKQYAKDHNIKLLEIWYWDFDNIEDILKKELNL